MTGAGPRELLAINGETHVQEIEGDAGEKNYIEHSLGNRGIDILRGDRGRGPSISHNKRPEPDCND